MVKSKQFSLNQTDLKKILIGAAIATSGALLTYVTSVVANTDFGTWTPVVVAVWSIVVNAVKKFTEGK